MGDQLKTSTRSLSVQVLRVLKHCGVPPSIADVVREVVQAVSPNGNKHEAKQGSLFRKCLDQSLWFRRRKVLQHRVEDVLSVLLACGVVKRQGKKVALLEGGVSFDENLDELQKRVEAKRAGLSALLVQHILLHELSRRNGESGKGESTQAISLPFFLVLSDSKQCEITQSDNLCHVLAKFSEPFNVVDDVSVLIAMGLMEGVTEGTIRKLVPEPLLGLLPDTLRAKLGATQADLENSFDSMGEPNPKKKPRTSDEEEEEEVSREAEE